MSGADRPDLSMAVPSLLLLPHPALLLQGDECSPADDYCPSSAYFMLGFILAGVVLHVF